MLGVRMGKPGPHVQLAIRFRGCKDLGFKTTEKLVKKTIAQNASQIYIFFKTYSIFTTTNLQFIE